MGLAAGLLLLGTLAVAPAALAVEPGAGEPVADIRGDWLVEGDAAVVRIGPCDAWPGAAWPEGVPVSAGDDPDPVYCGRLYPLADEPNAEAHCGFALLAGLRARPDEGKWNEGVVIDPRSGTRYSAAAWLDDEETLVLRGFVLSPLLGKSQTWTRWSGEGALCDPAESADAAPAS